jgi:hypothetical protein
MTAPRIYIRSTDAATMIEVAPHCFVALGPAVQLGLLAQGQAAAAYRRRQKLEQKS